MVVVFCGRSVAVGLAVTTGGRVMACGPLGVVTGGLMVGTIGLVVVCGIIGIIGGLVVV